MPKYQNICLYLSDGRKIKVSVPAFMQPGDYITIKDVTVTEAQELPEGHSWGTLDYERKGDKPEEDECKCWEGK